MARELGSISEGLALSHPFVQGEMARYLGWSRESYPKPERTARYAASVVIARLSSRVGIATWSQRRQRVRSGLWCDVECL